MGQGEFHGRRLCLNVSAYFQKKGFTSSVKSIPLLEETPFQKGA